MTFIKFLQKRESELRQLYPGGKRGLVITVSGLSGSGKSEVARMLAKSLMLEYHSTGGIIRDLAKETGKSIVDYCKMRGDEVDYMADKESLRLAMQGNVVLDGRLTGWAAGNLADSRIFVFCPPEVRASRVSTRDATDFEDALRNLMRRDVSDRSRYMKLYNIDMLDKSIYDRIIDNSGSFQELEEKVEAIIKSVQIKASQKS